MPKTKDTMVYLIDEIRMWFFYLISLFLIISSISVQLSTPNAVGAAYGYGTLAIGIIIFLVAWNKDMKRREYLKLLLQEEINDS